MLGFICSFPIDGKEPKDLGQKHWPTRPARWSRACLMFSDISHFLLCIITMDFLEFEIILQNIYKIMHRDSNDDGSKEGMVYLGIIILVLTFFFNLCSGNKNKSSHSDWDDDPSEWIRHS